MKAIYEPTYDALGWFDETLTASGWLDQDLIDTVAPPPVGGVPLLMLMGVGT